MKVRILNNIDPYVILTDIETVVIKSFSFESLYNFKKEANSSLGYKHTIDAINKMKFRLKDKSNHPMFGKTHTRFALSKISKPGNLNPMFGKTHSSQSHPSSSSIPFHFIPVPAGKLRNSWDWDCCEASQPGLELLRSFPAGTGMEAAQQS